MKSYATFRRHALGQVIAPAKEDRHPLEVVPFGRFGAGVWTGHPVELLVVAGILLIGLIGIPEWRWFFGAAVLAGVLWGMCSGGAINRKHNRAQNLWGGRPRKAAATTRLCCVRQ